MSRTDRAPDQPPARLRAGIRVVRRDRSSWQVGLDPARAVVVHGLDPAGAEALRRLAGPVESPAGPPLPGGLLAALAAHGLLAPEPPSTQQTTQPSTQPSPLGRVRHSRVRARTRGDVSAAELAGDPDPVARRVRARVLLAGSGPVAATVAVALAHAGVGTVALASSRRPVVPADVTPVGPAPTQVGDPWVDVVSAVLRRLGTRTTLLDAAPSVVVIADCADADLPWTDPTHGEAWLRAGVPHLSAAVAGLRGEVSPLVLPGRTPCLWCEDLARADADPCWPLVADQLRRLAPGPPTVLPSAVVATTSALAAARTTAYLDGTRHAGTDPSRRLVVTGGGSTVESVPVTGHPACGCGWVPGIVTMDG